MRIDDDSTDRAAEARAQDRKLQQQQVKRRAEEASTFDKALAGKRAEAAVVARHVAERPPPVRSPVKELLAKADPSTEHRAEDAAMDERAKPPTKGPESDRNAARALEHRRGGDRAVAASIGERVESGQRDQEGQSLTRKQDTATDEKREQLRDGRSGGAAAGRATATPGKVTAREQKGQQDGQGKQDSQGQPGAFRLPPSALMAPPPVAVPKEAPQVSRLRALAQEIAEKIVKAARVGVNKMGLPEFQLELKSDILQGLKVKVSGRHGRIRAHFSSRDPKVLKQLRGEIEGLRSALSARGLKVDALEIEEERA